MNFESLRKRLSYHTALLGLAVLVTSAILVTVDVHTKDEISQRMAEDLKAKLAQVIPSNMYDNQILKDTVTIQGKDDEGKPYTTVFYRARKHGKIVAFAFPAMAYGYSGAIHLIIGVNTRGKVLGVRVISHHETPGLGDKIEADKSNWIFSFTGKSLKNPPPDKWKVKKDGGVFDQFTGATITPRGVVKGIKYSLEFFSAHRKQLLQDSSGPKSKRKD